MSTTRTADRPKRALILAGGGLKVAFQAGVLQVWLDEAGLTFDDADGASGGVFNLAMYCQGMTGRQIADNWRLADPKRGIAPNWRGLARGPFAPSLFTLDKYRRNVFRDWGLDWDRIRSSPHRATFNAYDFSRNRLTVREPATLDEDFLVAAVSLPMWFPPVVIDGDTYIDAVYITDANLEEAIRRGADELWVVWTVSQQRVWRPGFLAQYFQVIETAANGHFQRVLDRIAASNALGDRGEFGRHVEVKVLQAEVPLHYLVTFSQDRVAEVVNRGVRAARAWCAENGIAVTPAVEAPAPRTRLSFTEGMSGWFGFGETDPRRGALHGRDRGTRLAFRLTIDVDGVNRFLLDPLHEAAVHGRIDCEALGGRLPVTGGGFNLFVQQDVTGHQRMYYRLHFADSAGHPLTLLGHKDVRDDAGRDLWADTTTLYLRILQGHVVPADPGHADGPAQPGGADGVVGAGVLRLTPLDLARQLTTVRAYAPTAGERVEVVRRFGQLFLGKLWDVYAQEVLSSSPI
ncbi:patatin-like phospholipase family protein [Geodermatophilus amargosae]|uniref:patatin-like phospholipase family protein n=1 Tax=Geodermatophilus amargosae TaxID=1296565 RepID=UPI0034DDF49E